MNFIFMLTQGDQTVPDARQILDIAIEQGVRHLGFKDVGASREQMKSITEAIGEAGGTSYMEVVSTTSESIRRSMEAAREIGVDYVLGGQDLDSAREILEGGLAGTTRFQAGRGVIPRHSTARPRTSPATAAPSSRPAVPASTCSPTGRPRPTRSNWSAQRAPASPAAG
ncbi:MAG: hypothetical protein M5U09_01750 [Gammaproteobacteria bacterium]|nr:hypothetical protein [Gammaproteobacteria bacterium]